MRRPERAGHPMASEILLASHVPGLTPDALALASPACLLPPPPGSGDCAATLPAARRSASPYLLAVGSPLPAKGSHVRRPDCACPSCSPFLQDGLCILVGA